MTACWEPSATSVSTIWRKRLDLGRSGAGILRTETGQRTTGEFRQWRHDKLCRTQPGGGRGLSQGGARVGGKDEGAVGPRSWHPNAYAAYVRDLDGNKLAAYCFKPE